MLLQFFILQNFVRIGLSVITNLRLILALLLITSVCILAYHFVKSGYDATVAWSEYRAIMMVAKGYAVTVYETTRKQIEAIL